MSAWTITKPRIPQLSLSTLVCSLFTFRHYKQLFDVTIGFTWVDFFCNSTAVPNTNGNMRISSRVILNNAILNPNLECKCSFGGSAPWRSNREENHTTESHFWYDFQICWIIFVSFVGINKIYYVTFYTGPRIKGPRLLLGTLGSFPKYFLASKLACHVKILRLNAWKFCSHLCYW